MYSFIKCYYFHSIIHLTVTIMRTEPNFAHSALYVSPLEALFAKGKGGKDEEPPEDPK